MAKSYKYRCKECIARLTRIDRRAAKQRAELNREEAIHNISVATGEPEDIVRRRAKAIAASCSLSIVNIHDNINPIEQAARKSYVSPYAKFDKIRRKRK